MVPMWAGATSDVGELLTDEYRFSLIYYQLIKWRVPRVLNIQYSTKVALQYCSGQLYNTQCSDVSFYNFYYLAHTVYQSWARNIYISTPPRQHAMKFYPTRQRGVFLPFHCVLSFQVSTPTRTYSHPASHLYWPSSIQPILLADNLHPSGRQHPPLVNLIPPYFLSCLVTHQGVVKKIPNTATEILFCLHVNDAVTH